MDDDDKSLLKRFYQAGDDEAFALFVTRHLDWARTRARSFLANEADDIVQVSILRMMDCEPTNGEVSNPLGWWMTILSATAMDHMRSSVRRKRREESADNPSESNFESVEDALATERLLGVLYEEIDQLEGGFRGPLIRRYFEGMSYKEIAEALACSTGTVGSRLTRGIAQLKERLVARDVLKGGDDDQG